MYVYSVSISFDFSKSNIYCSISNIRVVSIVPEVQNITDAGPQ